MTQLTFKSPVFSSNSAAMDNCFYSRVAPTQVADPQLIRTNNQLAEFLQIDPHWLNSQEGLAVFCGT